MKFSPSRDSSSSVFGNVSSTVSSLTFSFRKSLQCRRLAAGGVINLPRMLSVRRFMALCALCMALAVLEGEYLAFYRASVGWEWPGWGDGEGGGSDSTSVANEDWCVTNGGKEVRVLMVSDPQIVGEEWEKPYMKRLTIWDCDSYLGNSFSWMISKLHPDMVFVLGDVVDELYFTLEKIRNLKEKSASGDSDASAALEIYEQRLKVYSERTRRVFQMQAGVDGDSKKGKTTVGGIPIYFIPGDNDVGGEGRDVLRAETVEYFEREFGKANGVITADNGSSSPLKFVAVNSLGLWMSSFVGKDIKQQTIDAMLKSRAEIDKDSQISKTRQKPVLLTHLPLNYLMAEERKLIFSVLEPQIGFASHTHHYAENTYAPHDRYIEVVVPTMSYRMGTEDIGFVTANFCTMADSKEDEDSLSVKYKKFQLPVRFFYLRIYGYIIAIALVRLLIESLRITYGCFFMKTKNVSHSSLHGISTSTASPANTLHQHQQHHRYSPLRPHTTHQQTQHSSPSFEKKRGSLKYAP
eukprot:Nk52_evm122s151 gene=Nk52_evmTU122s151